MILVEVVTKHSYTVKSLKTCILKRDRCAHSGIRLRVYYNVIKSIECFSLVSVYTFWRLPGVFKLITFLQSTCHFAEKLCFMDVE